MPENGDHSESETLQSKSDESPPKMSAELDLGEIVGTESIAEVVEPDLSSIEGDSSMRLEVPFQSYSKHSDDDNDKST